jgi:hypothetical protein
MAKKSTHLVKKGDKIVKSEPITEVISKPEKAPEVPKDVYDIHCGKCGKGITPKQTCSLGQGLYLCKKCYSEG